MGTFAHMRCTRRKSFRVVLLLCVVVAMACAACAADASATRPVSNGAKDTPATKDGDLVPIGEPVVRDEGAKQGRTVQPRNMGIGRPQQQQQQPDDQRDNAIQSGKAQLDQQQRVVHMGHSAKDHSPEAEASLSRQLRRHMHHENLHAFIFMAIMMAMIGAQVGIVWWKTNYPKAYQKITSALLWIIPAALAFSLSFWRFLFIWLCWSITTLYVGQRAFLERPLAPATPRIVYGWFLASYRIAYIIATIGYVTFILEFLGLGEWIPYLGYWAIMGLFYGLYFGVLSRDIAEVCTDKLAASLGFSGTSTSMPLRVGGDRVCAVCNVPLPRGGGSSAEDVVQLDACGHTFHEFCIRGWTIVGKKDTCPQCHEKVELGKLFPNPWEKQSVMWANVLDIVRYLAAWNPLVMMTIQAFVYLVDPE